MTDTLPPIPSSSGDLVPLEKIGRDIIPRQALPLGSEGEASRSTPQGPPLGGRKRGGQRGNKNALKHGFYSHTFSRREIQRLDDDVQGELRDEEEYLRVLIPRTAESAQTSQLTHAEKQSTLRAVTLAMGRIESLHRTRRALYDKQTTIDKVWEELKYLPVEED